MPFRLRSGLAEVASAIDRTAVRLPPLARRVLVGPVLFSVMVGSGVWAIRNPLLLSVFNTNKLTEPDSIKIFKHVLGALGAFVLVSVAVVVWRRLRTGHARVLETTAELQRCLFPLLAMPLVAILNLTAIERESPKTVLFFIAIAAAMVAYGVYAWPVDEAGPDPASSPRDPSPAPATPSVIASEGRAEETAPSLSFDGATPPPDPSLAPSPSPSLGGAAPPPDPDAPPSRGERLWAKATAWGAWIAVLGLWAGYGYLFSHISITNHHALNTRTTDLGYYDNIFYQTIHGKLLACGFIKGGSHASAHFDPILIPLSPFYLLYPRAEFLLALQSFWLGAGVVPIYLLAKDRLRSRGAGLVLATVYVLYPALHGANLYEFHSLTLLTPILLWMLYLLEIRAHRAYFALLLLALLCREDVALLMCFVGLFGLVDRRPERVRIGWITIAASIAYFVLIKKFFMPSEDILNGGAQSYSYAYYYEELINHGKGVRDLVLSLLTNPVFLLEHCFSDAKIQYLLLLFMPLAFLPLLAKPGRVMLIYGLLFCLLATRGAVFSVHFQYSSILLPVAFAIAPEALRQRADGPLVASLGLERRRVVRGVLAACLVTGALICWKFGAVLENQSFRGGFSGLIRTLSPEQQGNYEWLEANRDTIPKSASLGVTSRTGAQAANRMNVSFYPERNLPDYVFIDETELKAADLEKHKKLVDDGELVEMSRHGQLVILKKNKKKKK